MRVFVPATAALLRVWADRAQIEPVAVGHGVTPALAEWFSAADQDELEYVALVEAGEGSLRLLADDVSAAARRIVLAADVEVLVAAHDVEPTRRSAVQVPATIAFAAVQSILLDDETAAASVEAAVAGVRDGAGADQLEQLFDDVAEHELMWFDVTEVAVVLGLAEVTR